MAYSTQKDFIKLVIDQPRQTRKITLKTYPSCMDSRAWSLCKNKRGRYITDLIVCDPCFEDIEREPSSVEKSKKTVTRPKPPLECDEGYDEYWNARKPGDEYGEARTGGPLCLVECPPDDCDDPCDNYCDDVCDDNYENNATMCFDDMPPARGRGPLATSSAVDLDCLNRSRAQRSKDVCDTSQGSRSISRSRDRSREKYCEPIACPKPPRDPSCDKYQLSKACPKPPPPPKFCQIYRKPKSCPRPQDSKSCDRSQTSRSCVSPQVSRASSCDRESRKTSKSSRISCKPVDTCDVKPTVRIKPTMSAAKCSVSSGEYAASAALARKSNNPECPPRNRKRCREE